MALRYAHGLVLGGEGAVERGKVRNRGRGLELAPVFCLSFSLKGQVKSTLK